ncbi:ferredoxin [Candidatus Riflebacteria bacterium]
MADPENKVKGNVDGPWYVDTECIDCDNCRAVAPGFFKKNEDEGHSIVYKQPQTAEEKAECEQAMDECPVEAIGNDG